MAKRKKREQDSDYDGAWKAAFRRFLQELWLEIQDCKHAISQLSKTPVICNFGGLRARLEVTRQQFEEMTRDLLVRTETTTKLVVRDAGFVPDGCQSLKDEADELRKALPG